MKRRIAYFALALMAAPAYASQLGLDYAEVYYGDYNDDGVVDFYIKTKPLVIIAVDDITVPVFANGRPVLIKSSASQSGLTYTTTIDPGPVNYDATTLGAYTIVRGDFNGDRLQDVLFKVNQPGKSSILMLSSNSAPFMGYIQTLSVSNIGYDLGAAGTAVVTQDVNGDGRADLIIKRNGSYAGVLIANANGTISGLPQDQDTEITVAMVWVGFKGALSLANVNEALQFIHREPRQKYAEIFSELGVTVAADAINSIQSFQKLEVSDGIATYGVTRDVDGQLVANIVTFFRDGQGVWRIDGL